MTKLFVLHLVKHQFQKNFDAKFYFYVTL